MENLRRVLGHILQILRIAPRPEIRRTSSRHDSGRRARTKIVWFLVWLVLTRCPIGDLRQNPRHRRHGDRCLPTESWSLLGCGLMRASMRQEARVRWPWGSLRDSSSNCTSRLHHRLCRFVHWTESLPICDVMQTSSCCWRRSTDTRARESRLSKSSWTPSSTPWMVRDILNTLMWSGWPR